MIAPKYHLDTVLVPFSVGRSGLVSRQLFSHGQHRVTLRRQIWNQQGVGLDGGLEAGPDTACSGRREDIARNHL